MASSRASSSSSWQLSHMKPRISIRIRKLFRFKTAETERGKPVHSPEQNGISAATVDLEQPAKEEDDDSVALQRAVKRLHFGGSDEKKAAAAEIERLARADVNVKKQMAELRVIPALVKMVAAPGLEYQAIRALLELSKGNYMAKALMVEAGVLSKLPGNIDEVDEPTRRDLSHLILSLSSLNNIDLPCLNSTLLLPFALAILESDTGPDTKAPCLATLYNMSTVLDNAAKLGSDTDLVHSILRVMVEPSNKCISEKALATIGNVVVTLPGRRAVEGCGGLAVESLIEALTWEDTPKCQELAAYALMVLAHQSPTMRAKMAADGIVPVLLEVALLGSPLAQKRALKLLQWFKDERQVRVGPHSGPPTPARASMGSPVADRRAASEGKRTVQRLVQESLHRNMELIARRASSDRPGTSAAATTSKLKSLVVSTSSKSLPY
ncbi:hypothetical protein SAY86_031079 [Trapa natans]|uniref:Uncharacterized protein n=1 Tax=Trapa natans TaxID=22666 RepID=A0AAN7RJ79_TRANT|nr:hypothetical protein SAY86_031079 [Trapa natans]